MATKRKPLLLFAAVLVLFTADCGQAPQGDRDVATAPAPAEPMPLPPPPPPPNGGHGSGSMGTTTPTVAAFPQFPCAPPRPSDMWTVPRAYVAPAGPAPTLGGVEAKLKGALAAAAYPGPRIYQTCGGFALVGAVERARADGTPFPQPGRFVDLGSTMSVRESFSLAEVLRALFTVQPGRYRLSVIVVSNRETIPTAVPMSEATARAIMAGGASRLPPWLRDRPFTPDHEATALVYEFEKPPGAASARLVAPPRFPASRHLELAGILPALRGR